VAKKLKYRTEVFSLGTTMSMESIELPILGEAVPTHFRYGSMIVVEFEPQSLWYETSLTIAANALQKGLAVDYHAFQHPPAEIKQGIARLGADFQRFERAGKLRILDSYSVQSGIEPQSDAKELSYGAKSLDVSTWREASRALKPDATTAEGRRRIHIDENTTVLLQSNEEKNLSDFMAEFRSFAIKLDLVMINSLARGWASEALYSKVESMADAIFDFRAEITDEVMHHVMRTRMVRGMSCDTRWKDLKLGSNGAVSVSSHGPRSEPGISGWLKGPRG
jgi:KaiC/GvpD/RAD55 family RecA-like ATPase